MASHPGSVDWHSFSTAASESLSPGRSCISTSSAVTGCSTLSRVHIYKLSALNWQDPKFLVEARETFYSRLARSNDITPSLGVSNVFSFMKWICWQKNLLHHHSSLAVLQELGSRHQHQLSRCRAACVLIHSVLPISGPSFIFVPKVSIRGRSEVGLTIDVAHNIGNCHRIVSSSSGSVGPLPGWAGGGAAADGC